MRRKWNQLLQLGCNVLLPLQIEKVYHTNKHTRMYLPIWRNQLDFQGFWPVWPEKNRRMSIKVAQKWLCLKYDRFWHLCKNCLRMWEIWEKLLLPKALKSYLKCKKLPNLVTLELTTAECTLTKQYSQFLVNYIHAYFMIVNLIAYAWKRPIVHNLS